MEYPNDFDTPAFPAGKTVAFSRAVSIWISIVFFLIICTCGFILLGLHFRKNYPFLISIDLFTNEWNVISYPYKDIKETIPRYQVIQERLVRYYVENWFSISGDSLKNEARWDECSVEECADEEQYDPENINCAIYCSSSSELFNQFSKKVVPEYEALIKDRNEKWTVGNMLITPMFTSENSSSWQVYVTITSSNVGKFNVLTFIEIERDPNYYPANLGYYISDFNAYRIVNEVVTE